MIVHVPLFVGCLKSIHYISTQMEVSNIETGLGTSEIAALAVDRGTNNLIYNLQTLMQQLFQSALEKSPWASD